MVQYDVKRVSKGSESFMVSFDYQKTPITQIADSIIIAGSEKKASDIHLDPREDGLMVRYRIDGDLQDYTFVPKAYEKNLTTRLKLLANMNITETRLPQDGAIKGMFGGTYLDMRVSCLPVSEGEKIVIRILDYTKSLQGIESLGFNEKNLEKLKKMIGVPNGIILVTGATGSGKSTTTYSMLQALNKPETNIITVEDPIEMNIEGINQVQVNAEIGMTFAAALRSILRQDPNIILLGEIRDSETAQIAVRASITGHLVLSTLHTNNSLSTIERLLDMDVERYLLSTALTGIISQRLAKQLCPHCRLQREATTYEKKVFKSILHQNVDTIWDANPAGCEYCRKGYRGRIAIQEVLELDDTIRNAINNPKLKKEELIKMVYNGKTITMLQDALLKVLDGQTSFPEVYRVIEIEDEYLSDDEDKSDKYQNIEDDAANLALKVANKEENKGEISNNTTPTPTQNQVTEVNPKVQIQQTVTQTNPVASQPVQEIKTEIVTPQAEIAISEPKKTPIENEVHLQNIISTPSNEMISNATQTETVKINESTEGETSILSLLEQGGDEEEVETNGEENSILNLLVNDEEEPVEQQNQQEITNPVLMNEEIKETSNNEEVKNKTETQEIKIEPKKVLTLEKLDDEPEDESNDRLITLPTNIEIKGPIEMNAEPLKPSI